MALCTVLYLPRLSARTKKALLFLVFSSDERVHFNCDDIDNIFSQRSHDRVWMSPDGSHMVHIPPEEGRVSHWGLNAPTLKPTGTSQLPGVEVATRRQCIIHGKERTMKDPISKQVHQCRYLLSSKVVTIVTADAGSVVVNVFLTLNFQLVCHYHGKHVPWPSYVALQIGFNDETGLSVFGASPTTVDQNSGEAVGILGVLTPIPGVQDKIKRIEKYFDTANDNVTKVAKSR